VARQACFDAGNVRTTRTVKGHMKKTAFNMLVVCLLASGAEAQQTPSISWEPFSFEAPIVGQTTAERGWLEVPLRHGRASGGRIRLPVVRLKTANPNPGPPVIFLAGGPGNAGTRILTGSLAPHAARVRAFADIIALDQRGTGSSEPSLAVPGRFEFPSSVSIDSPEARQRIATLGSVIRTTMQSRGIDLSAYNTVESADDVELLRQALGAEKVVLWGHSYGTHLALAVIKRHGQHVARALLGGVNGLDDRWRDPADSDAWLARVAAAINASAPAGPSVDFIDRVKRVFAQLDKEPLRVTTADGDVLIGKSEIQVLIAIQSGDLGFVQNLPMLFDSLEKRTRLDAIATAVQQTIRQRPIGTAMTYAMHVASGASTQRMARITAQAPTATLGNAINWGIGDEGFVKALGVTDLGDAFRAPYRSNVPVLLMSGTLDGRAVENDARRAGAQFEQPHYVTIEGASHDFWFLRPPPRLTEITDGFLRGEPVRDERVTWPVSFRRPD
jgi:pimeloyl-ACP methyl ester carboxylesterase